MLLRVLQKDLKKNKVLSVILVLFVFLASLLTSGSIRVLAETIGAADAMFLAAKAPHLLQMHAGPADEASIYDFAKTRPEIQDVQILPTLQIPGSSLFLTSGQSEADGIMDISFVTQSPSFDFLLDLTNHPAQVQPGEILVPVYYLQKDNLQTGDTVLLQHDDWSTELTIAGFLRDSAMNSSMASSKRFLISAEDYSALKIHFSEAEALIEFRLTDPALASEVQTAYQAAGLPQKGPAISFAMLRLMNVLSDGIAAGLLLFISLFLLLISLTCLRFMLLSAVEEDVREIGVMKAIGIPYKSIRSLILTKYAAIAIVSTLLGWIFSWPLGEIFSKNINLTMGTAPKTMLSELAPFAASAFCLGLIFLFCLAVLHRCQKLSAADALRLDSPFEKKKPQHKSLLVHYGYQYPNIFLGFLEIIRRPGAHLLLVMVFLFCSFLAIVPLNLQNTLKSPAFITYLGIGGSDIRLDLQSPVPSAGEIDEILSRMRSDSDITDAVPLATSQFDIQLNDGSKQSLLVESGDFTHFPLNYLDGNAPVNQDEIALSYLNAQDLDLNMGDNLIINDNGIKREMKICGIYQDITNGGRTAKALSLFQPDTARWVVINLSLASPDLIAGKIRSLTDQFPKAKVTGVTDYTQKTLASVLSQTKAASALALFLAAGLDSLISALFLKLLLSKERSSIAILRSIGFSFHDIAVQYTVRIGSLLTLGILFGTVFANTLGEHLTGAIMSSMGAPGIQFVINPIEAYLFCPLLLFVSVSAALLSGLLSIKKIRLRDMVLE